jgi:hypothetical protein
VGALVTGFEMRWPIVDPDVSRAVLMAQAVADLKAELPALGLVALSAPVFTWHAGGALHNHRQVLVARLAVRDQLTPSTGTVADD